MNKLEKFLQPKCLKCGAEAEVFLGDDGGCSDPECCGGTAYYAVVRCPECKIQEHAPPSS